MARHVPCLNDPGFALETEAADGSCTENEGSSPVGGSVDPHSGQYAEKMSVGKECHIAPRQHCSMDNFLCAQGDLLKGFSTRRDVIPDRPVRILKGRSYLVGGTSFIFAVIPFAEVIVNLNTEIEAGESGRLQSPLPWTAQDEGEVSVLQAAAHGGGSLSSSLGEGNVGFACMGS